MDDDIYYLYEIEAPAGYNRIEDPIKMDIQSVLNHEGTYTSVNATAMLTKLELYVADSSDPQTCNFKETGNVNCTIENFGGATLPETGGIGTTIFFVLGGLLIVGAGVLLIVRFRMKAFTDK